VLSRTVLRDVGLAGRNLRCISYQGWVSLPQTLELPSAGMLVFPRLEQLDVSQFLQNVLR
jgi:hypothetical protein